MTRKHRLSELTWYEVRERLREKPVILLPFASQEEQGPHAPMGDFMITEWIAGEVARRADALAAPTIPFGYSDYFRPFPGAICLRPETFCLLLEDICRSFLDHDVTHLVILNGHSGNYPLVDQTVRRLKQERRILIPCLNLWRLLPADLVTSLYGDRAGTALGHGGDPLTSVYLHLFPELMRMDLVETRDRKTALGLPIASLNAVRFEGQDVNVPLDADQINETGIVGGDPGVASAERGERLVEAIVALSVGFVTHFRTTDPSV